MAVLDRNRIFVTIAIFAVTGAVCAQVGYAEEKTKDIWQDGSAKQERPQEITPEQVKGFLDGLAKENKAVASKLIKLREKDPEKFREEIQNMMRKRAGSNGPKKPAGKDVSASGGKRRGGWSHERMKAEHDRYIKWLEQNYPDEAKQLETALKNDPENYIRRFWFSRRKYGQIMDLEKRNPELAEAMKEDMALQQRRDELVKNIRDAEGKHLEKIKSELKKIIERRFDLIVIKKQLKYEELKKRIKRLQQEVDQQEVELGKLKGQKKSQTANRLKELIGTSEKITWK